MKMTAEKREYLDNRIFDAIEICRQYLREIEKSDEPTDKKYTSVLKSTEENLMQAQESFRGLR